MRAKVDPCGWTWDGECSAGERWGYFCFQFPYLGLKPFTQVKKGGGGLIILRNLEISFISEGSFNWYRWLIGGSKHC